MRVKGKSPQVNIGLEQVNRLRPQVSHRWERVNNR